MTTAPFNTTFLGDDILIQYLNTIFRDTFQAMSIAEYRDLKYHRLLCFDEQTVQNLRNTITDRGMEYEFKPMVVVMIGTYDILDLNVTETTCSIMMDCLQDLMSHIQKQNVKKIALCTLPQIREAAILQSNTFERYNEFIRNFPASESIQIVDVHAALDQESMFERNNVLPNEHGYLIMHELLQDFL